MRIYVFFIVNSVLITLLSAASLQAANKSPLAGNENLFRKQTINIDNRTLHSWVQTTPGSSILLSWFDSKKLDITIQETSNSGKFTTLFGSINNKFTGSAVFVIGDGEFAGAINMGTDNYRIWPEGSGVYSLIEVNSDLLPEFPDTLETIRYADQKLEEVPTNQNHDVFEVLGEDEQIQLVRNDLANNRDIIRIENGSRIDILVAYSTESLDWAQRHNINMAVGIELMVGTANLHFVISGINTRLNLVGITEINHTVVDPKLNTDIDLLSTRYGTYSDVHSLRTSLKADLVSFLVLNGEQGCKREDGTKCGIANLPPRFMQAGDFSPVSSGNYTVWESEFASKGFSVVSVYNAFHNYTFTHEIGHNLGAHHDKWTHYYNNDGPSVDINARGWVMVGIESRTVMSYNNQCQALGMFCRILPLFSNPLMSVGSTPQGDPVAGNQADYMGPADNVSAINRMSRTVSNYRQRF